MNRRQLIGKLLVWGSLLALTSVALHLKHPLLYSLRSLETPVLLLVSGLGLAYSRRALARASSWPARLEPGLRLLALGVLGLLTLGQEGWFRWQQHQVLAASPAARYLGSHFIVGFHSFEEVRPLAERGLIGGIYLSRANLGQASLTSIRQQIAALQTLRRQAGLPPLFVAADQEGGPVSHLSPLLEPMPSLASLTRGEAGSLETRAQAYGERQGQALASLGVNLNLSPVVDLKPSHKGRWQDRHTLLEQRAISADPKIVSRIAGAYSAGLAASGVQPTLKHFPGLGRVQGDTHLVKAGLNLGPAQLARDWQPFREITARTGAAMMLGHVHLPAIDPVQPVSLSRPLVQELLRKQWGYQGLLITDDLNMGAVYADGIDKASIAALDAGVDLILISYDPDQYYRAMHAATRAWRVGSIGARREAVSSGRLAAYWRKRASPRSGPEDGAATMIESVAFPQTPRPPHAPVDS